MTKFKHIAVGVLMAVLTTTSAKAQNTIGGEARIVPEAEVQLQSAFIDAETERMLARYDKAITLYKKFLYDNEKNDAAWYGLARAEFAKDNLPGALDAIQKSTALDPSNVWYQVLLAEIYEKGGRLKDAVTVYEGLNKRFPNQQDHYNQLAYLQVLSGNPQAGLKTLERLEKISSLTEELAEKRHLIYVGLGDKKRATAELQRLADAQPTQIEYRRRLAHFCQEIGDAEGVRRAYEIILKQSPGDTEAKLALMSKSKNSSEADFLKSLQPVFRDNRTPIEAKLKEIAPYFAKLQAGNDPALTDALLELGRLVEAAHPDDASAWSLSGALFYSAKRPEEALERYRRCIRLNPTSFAVWDNTLSILQGMQQYDELLRTAEQAIDAFPNQAKAYYYYGMAANAKNKPDDALSQLEQALLMAADDATRLDITDQIGVALTLKKDYAGAIARYQKTQGSDRHAGCLEHYGDALYKSGDAKKALELWQQALKISKTPALERKIADGKL